MRQLINSTQIPNYLIHLFCKGKMGHVEGKIILAICRQTIGWHKETDWITFGRFKQLTNLSDSLLSRGIKSLIEKGLITREGETGAMIYSLNQDSPAVLQYGKHLTQSKATLDFKSTDGLTLSTDTKETNTKETIQVATEVAEGWNSKTLNEYLDEMLNGKPHIAIIANFLTWKGVGVDNGAFQIRSNKEMQFLIGRYLRAASRLAKTYPWPRINRTMEILGSEASFDWQLETVEKYIGYGEAELINFLKGLKTRTTAIRR